MTLQFLNHYENTKFTCEICFMKPPVWYSTCKRYHGRSERNECIVWDYKSNPGSHNLRDIAIWLIQQTWGKWSFYKACPETPWKAFFFSPKSLNIGESYPSIKAFKRSPQTPIKMQIIYLMKVSLKPLVSTNIITKVKLANILTTFLGNKGRWPMMRGRVRVKEGNGQVRQGL